MSFAKQHGVVNNIKNFLTNLFRSPQARVSPAKQTQDDQEASDYTALSEQGTGSETNPWPDDLGTAFASPEQQPDDLQQPEKHSSNEVITGGIYAVQDQQDGPYQLVQVIYVEEEVVHLLCFAEQAQQLSPELLEQELSVDLNREDGSFGLAHLPQGKADFIAHALLLEQRPLADEDLSGYRIFHDSVFDCLDEQAPDWLKKAGSYAAWRYDHNAMAALVDRYLIGVDLLRDSKKSLYWLNRLVHAGRGAVQPGDSITQEEQILTGGIYACPQEGDKRYRLCKVVLKDKHGVQQLCFPSLLDQLPEDPDPTQAVEQAAARRGVRSPALSHTSLDASGFLAQSPLFLGLLPVSIDELHCYRAHLRKMFEGAEFRKSSWEHLQKKARQGEIQAQMEVAYCYLDGDPLWEVKQDLPEAVRWLSEAANQGHGLAAYNLAHIFQQGGKGIEADPELGFQWLVYSAQLNYGLGQLHTANCYRQGQGCAANAALAHAWYSLAIVADNELAQEAKKRAKQHKYELEGSCSEEQLAEAKNYFQQLTASSPLQQP